MPGQGVDCRLGRAGVRLHVAAVVVQRRADVHDHALALLLPLLFEGLLVHDLAHVEGPDRVNLDDGPERVDRHVVQRRQEVARRAVYQKVDPREPLQHLVHHCRDRLRTPHVAHQTAYLLAVLLQLRHRGVYVLLLARQQHYPFNASLLAVVLQQALRYAEQNPGRTRNHAHFVAQQVLVEYPYHFIY